VCEPGNTPRTRSGIHSIEVNARRVSDILAREDTVDTKQHPGGGLPPVHEAWLPREHSLYRPRHSKHQTGALVVAVVFFAVPLFLFVIGVRPEAIENRRPADFPSLGNGFFTGLPKWAADNLPLRDLAIHAQGDISQGLFGEDPAFAGTGGGSDSPIGPVAQPQASEPAESGAGGVTSGGFPVVITGRDGWMYLGGDTEGKCRPAKSLDQVMTGLAQLKAAVEKSGRKFVLVVAPDKLTMLPEHLPSSYAGKDCAAKLTPLFWRRAAFELNVVDVRQALYQAVRPDQPIFFRQDSHWTYLGGLTMTRAIVDRLAPGQTATWKVQQNARKNRLTDLPPLLGRTGEENVPVYSLAPDGGTGDRTNWIVEDYRPYAVFTSEKTTGMIGGRVAMIADSFTNFATPYLAAAFSDLTVTHVENLNKDLSSVINRMIAADTVVVEVVERVVAAGNTPLVDQSIIATIDRVLAGYPVR